MEKNFLLAVVLAGLVLMLSQYYLTPPQPPAPAAKTEETGKQPEPAAPPVPSAAPAAPAPADAPVDTAAQVQAAQEEQITVETDLHKVVFSNRGAVVKSWILKSFKDSEGRPLELVNQKALATGGQTIPEPFSVAFKTTPRTNPNGSLYRVERPGDDGNTVTFEFSDGRTSAKKTFEFAQGTYLVMLSSQVIENGVAIPHSLAWRGGFGDATVPSPSADARAVYFDVPDNSLNKKQADDAESAPVSASGIYAFAGQEDKYFAAVMLPVQQGGTLELTTYADNVPKDDGAKDLRAGAAVGGSGANAFELYVGPKDPDILRGVDPRLDKLVDWGFFGFLAKPLFYALTWVYNTVIHNYGWAIILVTVVINLVLFPLRLSSIKSSRKMQDIKPLETALREKYKGIPMKDPRKQEMNQELMALYQKHGINPLGGCVPILLQIPFFIAFYTVLTVAIEMRGASWLWVTDLSQPETIAIRVLPILMAISQFVSQKMTPSPGMDPTQQKMMMIMPLVLFYPFYFFSAGLVLYWLTGNIVSIVQQWILNRNMPKPAPQVITAPATKKKK